jgi:hypothetical protein
MTILAYLSWGTFRKSAASRVSRLLHGYCIDLNYERL